MHQSGAWRTRCHNVGHAEMSHLYICNVSLPFNGKNSCIDFCIKGCMQVSFYVCMSVSVSAEIQMCIYMFVCMQSISNNTLNYRD